jgi:hypothetical protein
MTLMKLSTHTLPRYVVWIRYFALGSAIMLLLGLIYTDFVKYSRSRSVVSDVLDIFIILLMYTLSMLISVYFFGQKIAVTDGGLLVEFLGKDLMVSWDEIIEIRPAYGFLKSKNPKHVLVVLTNALTPFHRLLGLIYGLSLTPAFMISPAISEYQLLVEIIKKHVKSN